MCKEKSINNVVQKIYQSCKNVCSEIQSFKNFNKIQMFQE